MNRDNLPLISGNDVDGYQMPKYDSPSAYVNFITYKAWRKLWAEKAFEDIIDETDSKSVVTINEIILELPYHPDFPQVFFAYIVNRLEGCPPLDAEEVDKFMEDHYGRDLDRPDCDYLLDILNNGRHSVQAPKNVNRAVRWIRAKQKELGPWPPLPKEMIKHDKHALSPDATAIKTEKNNIVADTISHVQSVQNGNSEQYLRSEKGKNNPAASGSKPFDRLLVPPFSLPRLNKLLQDLGLIDDNNRKTNLATPKAWAGVVYALYEKGYIMKNGDGIAEALRTVYEAKVGKRTIQYVLSNSLTPDDTNIMYNKALSITDVAL
ncbi:hypothetical protein [Hymenobacter coccineus]|uniref:hypothetical protein n=1 Tax=Hymenobacter coccineus TaxID=1908235 RepID=UPI000F77DB4E|nr:hypothetical protein [Hymenobacter coccineus]